MSKEKMSDAKITTIVMLLSCLVVVGAWIFWGFLTVEYWNKGKQNQWGATGDAFKWGQIRP